jgi:hypothetical protein
LIDAGGIYEMNFPASKRPTDLNPIVLVIGAVVYRDGSIDGDAKFAAPFLAFTEGRKKALEQIVPLLQKNAANGTGRADLAQLIAKIDAVTDGGPRVNGRPSGPVSIAFAAVVTDTVGFLRRVETDFAGKSDAEVVAALSDLAKFYAEWQTRMNQ